MDVKYAGASTYNNIDFIRTRGFPSQVDFENGAKPENIAPEVLTKSKEEVQKDVDKEAEKIMKQLM